MGKLNRHKTALYRLFFFPDDPLKGDFTLFGHGVNNDD